jgi:hypothetical protein
MKAVRCKTRQGLQRTRKGGTISDHESPWEMLEAHPDPLPH